MIIYDGFLKNKDIWLSHIKIQEEGGMNID